MRSCPIQQIARKLNHEVMSYYQSITILFYVCSHRGDIRQEQQTNKTKMFYLFFIYTNFPTGLLFTRSPVCQSITVVKALFTRSLVYQSITVRSMLCLPDYLSVYNCGQGSIYQIACLSVYNCEVQALFTRSPVCQSITLRSRLYLPDRLSVSL